jgi:hypothetical protein
MQQALETAIETLKEKKRQEELMIISQDHQRLEAIDAHLKNVKESLSVNVNINVKESLAIAAMTELAESGGGGVGPDSGKMLKDTQTLEEKLEEIQRLEMMRKEVRLEEAAKLVSGSSGLVGNATGSAMVLTVSSPQALGSKTPCPKKKRDSRAMMMEPTSASKTQNGVLGAPFSDALLTSPCVRKPKRAKVASYDNGALSRDLVPPSPGPIRSQLQTQTSSLSLSSSSITLASPLPKAASSSSSSLSLSSMPSSPRQHVSLLPPPKTPSSSSSVISSPGLLPSTCSWYPVGQLKPFTPLNAIYSPLSLNIGQGKEGGDQTDKVEGMSKTSDHGSLGESEGESDYIERRDGDAIGGLVGLRGRELSSSPTQTMLTATAASIHNLTTKTLRESKTAVAMASEMVG